jgi:hypothetical protein
MSQSRFDDPGAGPIADIFNRLCACTPEEAIEVSHEIAAQLRATSAPLNAQRAEVALALAYLRAGKAEEARHHAANGQSLSEQNAATQTVFDHAITLAAAAKAQNLVGNGGEALRLMMLALAEAEKLGTQDRELFDRLFGEG